MEGSMNNTLHLNGRRRRQLPRPSPALSGVLTDNSLERQAKVPAT